eukprot:scaffold146454_cov16-Tisochrysis_lutea.AAC.2
MSPHKKTGESVTRRMVLIFPTESFEAIWNAMRAFAFDALMRLPWTYLHLQIAVHPPRSSDV